MNTRTRRCHKWSRGCSPNVRSTKDYEKLRLAFSLDKMREWLGPDSRVHSHESWANEFTAMRSRPSLVGMARSSDNRELS